MAALFAIGRIVVLEGAVGFLDVSIDGEDVVEGVTWIVRL